MRITFGSFASLVLVGAFATLACNHDGNGPTGASSVYDAQASLMSCGTNTSFFTAIPFEATRIGGWVPLGNLNPPAHSFPTDHQYIYLNGFSSGAVPAIPLYSPGDVTILYAKVTRYIQGGTVPEDYGVGFSPCAQVNAEFSHVRTIAPAILAQIGPFDQNCSNYSPNPGVVVQGCYSRNVKVAVKSGDVLGTAAGLDLSFFDSRIARLVFANPARWQANPNGIDRFHTAPMSDYYAEPMRSVVQSMLGSYDGRVKRTIAPIGGTIATDVAGTLQGAWFNPSQPTFPESPHLAIVPFNVDPTRIHVAMGTSQPGFLANEYYVSTASGPNINPNPAQVTPGAQIICYQFENQYGIALLQLSDATTLRFEGRDGQQRTCTSEQPWAFTASAVTFKR